jgi:hypothetical protein
MVRCLLVTVLLIPGGLACLESRSCTEKGCSDSAAITIQRADGNTPPLSVQLEVDGRRVTCPAPARGSAGGQPCDDPRVFVQHRERVDCTETRTSTAISQSCQPNGTFELVIGLGGTPARVDATVMDGATVVGQKTFDLNYLTVRPNGEGCEPVCRQGAETWQLPQ